MDALYQQRYIDMNILRRNSRKAMNHSSAIEVIFFHGKGFGKPSADAPNDFYPIVGDIMGLKTQIKAISFDAYGTILRLDRPFERLWTILSRKGLQIPLEITTKAFQKEMVYYRNHHMEGSDPEQLLDLRRRCADILFHALEEEGYAPAISREDRLQVLMDSIRFTVFEDVAPALDWCIRQGVSIAVISAWDCSLAATLKESGLPVFTCVMISAVEGLQKTDGQLFHRTAKVLGLPPEQILHVGDDLENDCLGPAKVGMPSILIDRLQAHRDMTRLRIENLMELTRLLA